MQNRPEEERPCLIIINRPPIEPHKKYVKIPERTSPICATEE